jgi:DNA-binding beta-propeller fold protein YncE
MVLRTIMGLKEPQGVGYVPFADSIFVANAGDGSVRVLRGEDLAPIGRIELGDDADNVRVDTARNRVIVGYGKGGLAIIDPATRTKGPDIRLKGHPEGFQIDETGTRVLLSRTARSRSSPARTAAVRPMPLPRTWPFADLDPGRDALVAVDLGAEAAK